MPKYIVTRTAMAERLIEAPNETGAFEVATKTEWPPQIDWEEIDMEVHEASKWELEPYVEDGES